MRRRSPTNSRPAEDLAYRQQYRDDPRHAYDELLPYFPSNGVGMALVPGFPKALSMHGTDACELHHSWGGRCGRWDKPWNLVAVCRTVHEWCEANKTDGRVLVIRLKKDKGLWDEEDVIRCLGFNPIGRLASLECRFPWAETIRRNLLAEM